MPKPAPLTPPDPVQLIAGLGALARLKCDRVWREHYTPETLTLDTFRRHWRARLAEQTPAKPAAPAAAGQPAPAPEQDAAD